MSPYLRTLSDAIKPDAYIPIDEWATDNFYLAKECSAESGKYRLERTPFVEEILKELSPQSKTQEIVLIKPTQLAGTTLGLIFLSYIADVSPGPTLFMQPTVDLVKDFSKERVEPTISLLPCLETKIQTIKARDSKNTIQLKKFPGGSWRFSGSNSPVSFRSRAVKYIILDDFDGFEPDIGGEGDPGKLADRRTGSFRDCKIYTNSTPTLKETSLIIRAYEQTSQGKFNVPCPHCNEFQYLRFGSTDSDFGIKFERDNDGFITDIWYQCEYCNERIDEFHKPWMLINGKYIHKYPDREKRGFKYNALYTPLGWKNNWKKIAEDFLEANEELKSGQPQKMITFTNTIMAEAWEGIGERPEWGSLYLRCEPYEEKTVPEGGLLLTCGVDTQDNRLAVLVKAWGRGEENWLVYHTEIWGDPNNDDVWDQLDLIINAGYPHKDGSIRQIESVAVDAMGHRTQAVYNYCRTRFPRVTAIQGISGENEAIFGRIPTPVDVTWKGDKIKEGCLLWKVGVHQAKVTIYSRLNKAGTGTGVYHWPIGTEKEYFKQLTAERLLLKYAKGYPRYEWVKDAGKNNEALDIEVYAYFAALRIGMNHPGFWENREKKPEIQHKIPPKDQKSNGYLGKSKHLKNGGSNWLRR